MSRPIGYAYEADLHCPRCTEKRFGESCEGTDGEGNPVSAEWSWDECDYCRHCGDCGVELMECDCKEKD